MVKTRNIIQQAIEEDGFSSEDDLPLGFVGTEIKKSMFKNVKPMDMYDFEPMIFPKIIVPNIV